MVCPPMLPNGPIRLGNRLRSFDGLLMGASQPARLGMLVGVTPGHTTLDAELQKAATGIRLGIDTLTDLTIGLHSPLLSLLIERTAAPVGTVPAYALFSAFKADPTRDLRSLLLRTLERQAREGADFFSVHMSLVRAQFAELGGSDRVIPMTSRGGAMVAAMMADAGCENPFFEFQDDILNLCAEYQITLSLVGSFRPGSIADAFDAFHLHELQLQSEIVAAAHARSVQTIVELVNHVSLDAIERYIQLGESLFDGSPIGCLGPSPTDIAIGFDDVAGAIAAAVAVWKGASWVNCITAGEHTYLPSEHEVERAIRFFRTALYIGGLASGQSVERDRKLSSARARNDWGAMATLSLFSDVAQSLMVEHGYHTGQPCDMCGGACPLVRTRHLLSTTHW